MRRPYKRTRSLGLGILRTCKQIHHDAALLPYLLNHFTFSSGDCFATFINSLVPAQAQAIQSMTLDNGCWTDFCIPTLQLNLLENLKDLTVFCRFAQDEESNSLFDHQASKDEMMKTMEVLVHLGVEKARVCCTSLHKGDKKNDCIVMQARLWSRLTEGVIEGRWGVAEKVKRSRLFGC